MRANSCAAVVVLVQGPLHPVSLAPIPEKHILHGSKNTLLALRRCARRWILRFLQFLRWLTLYCRIGLRLQLLDFCNLKVLGRGFGQSGEHNGIVCIPTKNFDSGHDVGFDSAHQMALDPIVLLSNLSVLVIVPTGGLRGGFLRFHYLPAPGSHR
jgi:hypothetical protein